MTMTDRSIVTGYRDTVILLGAIAESMAWLQNHDLPVLSLPIRAAELRHDVIRFEEILDRIHDRRTRTIIRCRYALGMKPDGIALAYGISRATVDAILRAGLHLIDGPEVLKRRPLSLKNKAGPGKG